MLHAQTNLSLSEPSTVAAAALPKAASRNVWIQSAAFDSCCFLLSPLAGLALILGDHWLPARESTLLILAAFYFIGIPHYLSTLTFYLGDDNLRQYRARPLEFFAGPLLILASAHQGGSLYLEHLSRLQTECGHPQYLSSTQRRAADRAWRGVGCHPLEHGSHGTLARAWSPFTHADAGHGPSAILVCIGSAVPERRRRALQRAGLADGPTHDP